ncbi:MAG: HD domain-containing protein [Candidatus Nanoarchaeia archaeon]
MPKQRSYELRDEIVKASQRDSPKLPYHNFEHEMRVRSAARTLANLEGISSNLAHLIDAAAMLHDVIMIPKMKDNEEKAAEYAGMMLPSQGYSKKDVKVVQRLILATKMPSSPQSLDEMILCDADVENLGTDDFLKFSKYIAKEQDKKYDSSFIKGLIAFLGSHKYYTASANKLWNEKKQENLSKLYSLFDETKEKEIRHKIKAEEKRKLDFFSDQSFAQSRYSD